MDPNQWRKKSTLRRSAALLKSEKAKKEALTKEVRAAG